MYFRLRHGALQSYSLRPSTLQNQIITKLLQMNLFGIMFLISSIAHWMASRLGCRAPFMP